MVQLGNVQTKSLSLCRQAGYTGLRLNLAPMKPSTVWYFEMGDKTATNQSQGLEVSDWLRTNMARDISNQ